MNQVRVTRAEVVLETDRLLLRPWRVSDAAVQRELWTERDPRVPQHRRIGPDGRPTLEDIENWIKSSDQSPSLGLLVAERKGPGDVIGYCGLIRNGYGQDGEPELAFEFLRKVWVRGMRPRPRGPSFIGRRRRATDVCGLQSVTGTPPLAVCWPNWDLSKPIE
jgi:[ribosomal protein S5]-alanine N-acetyltransferase